MRKSPRLWIILKPEQPDCRASRYESREGQCGRAGLYVERAKRMVEGSHPRNGVHPRPRLVFSRRAWAPLGARVACGVSAAPAYCCFQVWPPSSVTKRRRSATTVACSASLAAMPVQSMTPAGDATRCQCSPSIVRRTTPARPAIHATRSDGAEPASRSLVTPLVCSAQFWAWSVERATRPPGPIRQRTFPPGEAKVSGGGATAPAMPPAIPRAAKACSGLCCVVAAASPLAGAGAGACRAAGTTAVGAGGVAASSRADCASGEFTPGTAAAPEPPCNPAAPAAPAASGAAGGGAGVASAASSLFFAWACACNWTSGSANAGDFSCRVSTPRATAAGGGGTSVCAICESSGVAEGWLPEACPPDARAPKPEGGTLVFCAVFAAVPRGGAGRSAIHSAAAAAIPTTGATQRQAVRGRTTGATRLLSTPRGSGSDALAVAAATRRSKRSTSAPPSGSSALTVSTARMSWQRAQPAKCSSQRAVSAASRLWSAYAASNSASGQAESPAAVAGRSASANRRARA